MLTALRFTAYDIFRSELSNIQEDLLGFLFRDHCFFGQRSDAGSHVTAWKHRIRIFFHDLQFA